MNMSFCVGLVPEMGHSHFRPAPTTASTNTWFHSTKP